MFNSIYPKQESSGIIYEKDLQKSFSILMGKVYLWMTLALLITGFTAYSVAQSVSLMTIMFEHPLMVFGICGAEIALVFIISSRIRKLGLTQATILFILYSLLNGVTLSFTLLVYQEASIAKAFYNSRNLWNNVLIWLYYQEGLVFNWKITVFRINRLSYSYNSQSFL